MKVWTVLPPGQLREIAEDLGMRIHNDSYGGRNGIRKDGRAWNFRLALDVTVKKDGYARYHRTSASYFGVNADGYRRKVAAVCWHGHRDFMLAVFKLDPTARIKTAFADYKGFDEFMEKYPATGHKNIGSMMAPVMMAQACACHFSGWMIDLSIYPNVSSYNIRQSTIKSCPFSIFSPEHYRADGTCKCDDPEHQKFMIKEWGYSREDFAA